MLRSAPPETKPPAPFRARAASCWSGRRDSNSRPSAPQTDALTRLRYGPTGRIHTGILGRGKRESSSRARQSTALRPHRPACGRAARPDAPPRRPERRGWRAPFRAKARAARSATRAPAPVIILGARPSRGRLFGRVGVVREQRQRLGAVRKQRQLFGGLGCRRAACAECRSDQDVGGRTLSAQRLRRCRGRLRRCHDGPASATDRRIGHRHDMTDALLAQHLLHAADRQAVVVQQPLDAGQQRHVRGAVVAPPAGALDRADLRKPAFPEAQHMGGRIEKLGDLADGAEGVGATFPCRCRPVSACLPAATRSFIRCDGRKVSTRRGLIGTSSPVLGLRPTRADLSRTEKVPKDEILTVSPGDQRVGHVLQHRLRPAVRIRCG